ncbi:biotin/lipoyl-binding protein [bacterium]|nr:biotin/lipoyl-binding protein [bacterium]
MTRLPKMRSLLVAAGGVALVGSLLGARLLGPGGGGGTDATGKAPPAPAGKDTTGTVVLGTADSDPPPARYGLPPVLQSGQVVEVYVKQGEEVKAGQKLYRFSAPLLEAKVTEAVNAVDVARAKLAEARGEADLHASNVALQAQMVKAAETSVKLAADARLVGEWNKKEYYKGQGITPERWPDLLKNEPELFDLFVKHQKAEIERDLAKVKLDAVKAAQEKKLAPVVAVAEAEVKRYEALAADARELVAACTVTARVDGTVERVSVSPGDVMGISSQAPALVLIPAGPRVVRAEVEAEFASKIGPNQIGRQVIVHDFTDPKVTFKGVVRGPLGGSFLRGSDRGARTDPARPAAAPRRPARAGDLRPVTVGMTNAPPMTYR